MAVDPRCDSASPFSAAWSRHQVDRLPQERGGSNGWRIQLDLPGLELGEVQHVVDHREQRLGALGDAGDVATRVGRQSLRWPPAAGETDDAGQRRADLVAHVGQELGSWPRAAASASARLRRSSSSSARLAVTSRSTAMAPITWPSSPVIGEVAPSKRTRRPSVLRCSQTFSSPCGSGSPRASVGQESVVARLARTDPGSRRRCARSAPPARSRSAALRARRIRYGLRCRSA